MHTLASWFYLPCLEILYIIPMMFPLKRYLISNTTEVHDTCFISISKHICLQFSVILSQYLINACAPPLSGSQSSIRRNDDACFTLLFPLCWLIPKLQNKLVYSLLTTETYSMPILKWSQKEFSGDHLLQPHAQTTVNTKIRFGCLSKFPFNISKIPHNLSG